jgi:hypothetical protein
VARRVAKDRWHQLLQEHGRGGKQAWCRWPHRAGESAQLRGDGSVIVLSQVSAFSIYPHIYSKLTYQAKDFEPISIGAIMHHGLAVGLPCRPRSRRSRIFWLVQEQPR